jgi:hypothetical protein
VGNSINVTQVRDSGSRTRRFIITNNKQVTGHDSEPVPSTSHLPHLESIQLSLYSVGTMDSLSWEWNGHSVKLSHLYLVPRDVELTSTPYAHLHDILLSHGGKFMSSFSNRSNDRAARPVTITTSRHVATTERVLTFICFTSAMATLTQLIVTRSKLQGYLLV